MLLDYGCIALHPLYFQSLPKRESLFHLDGLDSQHPVQVFEGQLSFLALLPLLQALLGQEDLLLLLDQFLGDGVFPLREGLDVDGVGFGEVGATGAVCEGFERHLHFPGLGGHSGIESMVLLADGDQEQFIDVIVLQVDQVLVALGQGRLALLV